MLFVATLSMASKLLFDNKAIVSTARRRSGMLGALQYNDSINNQIASSGSGGRFSGVCISLSLGGGTHG